MRQRQAEAEEQQLIGEGHQKAEDSEKIPCSRPGCYEGGYTILRQRVKQLRPQRSRPPVERFETGPGVQAQMDYAIYTLDFTQEGRRKVNLFSYVLGHCRRQYLRFTVSADMETTVREHVRAFEHLGGVAATCLYDNMKVVVARCEDDEPIYNTRFLAFATHYGFRPVACRRRRPQTKGKVERPFYFVETNLLSGREFRSLDHLNEVTDWWLAEVADVRVHRQTRRRPIDMHAEELPHLIPLPERAYEVAEVVYRTVDAEGFVAYGQNRYSAPWQNTFRPGISSNDARPCASGSLSLDRSPCAFWRGCSARNAVAGTRPRRCWPCWEPIAARISWPRWIAPSATGRSR